MQRFTITIIASILCQFFGGSMLFAENGFTVSGEVFSKGENTVYVYLLDNEGFRTMKKTLPENGHRMVVKPAQIENGRASFNFTNVPKGDYVIFAFVDSIENGKADFDGWGMPKEQMYFYKEADMWSWYDQKFSVDKDITGIQLFR